MSREVLTMLEKVLDAFVVVGSAFAFCAACLGLVKLGTESGNEAVRDRR